VEKSVSIRMGTTGKADVTRTFDEMAASGEASANRWSKAYDRAGQDVEAALQRQANAAAKIAAIVPQTAIQMQANAAAGSNTRFGGGYAAGAGERNGLGEGSARASAAVFKELIAAEEQLEARTRALVASIDPVWAAQQRFNAEMENARDLISNGKISLDQYVTKLGQERAALDSATAAQQRGAVSAGAHRAAMQGLSFQAQDAMTQLSMGANVFNVIAVQGAQAAGQMANLEGKLGSAAKFMIGPWGLAITGGLMLLGMLTDRLMQSRQASEADEAAKRGEAAGANTLEGAIKALNDITGVHNRSQAVAIDLAIGNADAMLKQAEATRAATAARLADMKALQAANRQRASGPGQNSEMVAIGLPAGDEAIASVEATLSKLDASIIRGQNAVRFARAESSRQHAVQTADELDRNSRLRISTGAVADAERNLAKVREEGRSQLAAKKITPEEYAAKSDEAERRLVKAQEDGRHSSDRRAASLGRQAAAMEVNADASLELARAYLVGGAAALRAEAARKGLTDATRRGIDSDAQVARQLQVMVGEQVANGAKSVAQLREETEARAAVRAQVLAGTLPVEGMAQALSDEAALRPLLKLQTVAQGEALTELTKVIEAYRKALADAHEEEARSGAAVETRASKDRFAETIESIRDLGKDPLQRALDAARRAAERDADAKKLTGEDRTGFVDARVSEARATEGYRRAQFYVSTADDQRDSLELAKLELSLAASGNDERDRAMAKLEMILRMKREGITADSEEGRKLLENQERLDGVATQAKLAAAGFRELRDFGNDFVDTVLSEDTWSSWGNAGKTILNMLKSEFVKLALLNPLKNLINGDKALPTLSGLVGKIGNLFGPKGVGNNAAGTEWWSGGATWLAENGPEIVNLPQGSRVTSAAETRRLFAANDAGSRAGGLTVIVNAQDAVLADTVRGWVSEGVGLASAQGAAGGAAMAEANDMAAGTRTLGRWRR
jgi:hypothetical protein